MPQRLDEPRSYYAATLYGERLKSCYDLAPARVQEYLASEIEFVRGRMIDGMRVLEMGCGYGRVLKELAGSSIRITGVDLSLPSLKMAARHLGDSVNVSTAAMDAIRLGFRSRLFDLVICVQNGISAFQVDPLLLVRSAIGAARHGGSVLFSSYADTFWEDRLEWFRIQSAHGLLGEIDEERTGNGTIVTKDGFRASTMSPDLFMQYARILGVAVKVTVVSGASIFFEIHVE